MADVQFTEEQQYAPRTYKQKMVSSMSAWLVKNQFAKDEAQANLILLFVVGAAVIIAIGILFFSGSSPGDLSPEERAIIEQSTIQPPLVY